LGVAFLSHEQNAQLFSPESRLTIERQNLPDLNDGLGVPGVVFMSEHIEEEFKAITNSSDPPEWNRVVMTRDASGSKLFTKFAHCRLINAMLPGTQSLARLNHSARLFAEVKGTYCQQ